MGGFAMKSKCRKDTLKRGFMFGDQETKEKFEDSGRDVTCHVGGKPKGDECQKMANGRLR